MSHFFPITGYYRVRFYFDRCEILLLLFLHTVYYVYIYIYRPLYRYTSTYWKAAYSYKQQYIAALFKICVVISWNCSFSNRGAVGFVSYLCLLFYRANLTTMWPNLTVNRQVRERVYRWIVLPAFFFFKFFCYKHESSVDFFSQVTS